MNQIIIKVEISLVVLDLLSGKDKIDIKRIVIHISFAALYGIQINEN